MSTSNQENLLVELLEIYRRNLRHLLARVARQGGEHNASLLDMNEIRTQRQHIQQTKDALRALGVAVVDLTTDKEPADPSSSRKAPLAASANRRQIRDALFAAFSLEELDILCADIQDDLQEAGIRELLNMELVGGSGKQGKVLKLIEYLSNRGYLQYLADAIRRARPGLLTD